jgi:hypothetical protein
LFPVGFVPRLSFFGEKSSESCLLAVLTGSKNSLNTRNMQLLLICFQTADPCPPPIATKKLHVSSNHVTVFETDEKDGLSEEDDVLGG